MLLLIFMFISALVPLLFMLILTTKASRYSKGKIAEKRSKLLLGVIVTATVLCLVFAVLGHLYIEHYGDVNGGCPSQYPYSWAIVAAGLVGLLAFAYATISLLRQRLSAAGIMMFISSILFTLVVAASWFGAVFCITF